MSRCYIAQDESPWRVLFIIPRLTKRFLAVCVGGQQLKTPGPYPEGIWVEYRERYLSDADFKRVLGVDKDAFKKMPGWKQQKKKKEVRCGSMVAVTRAGLIPCAYVCTGRRVSSEDEEQASAGRVRTSHSQLIDTSRAAPFRGLLVSECAKDFLA
jgi:hypothetical protein